MAAARRHRLRANVRSGLRRRHDVLGQLDQRAFLPGAPYDCPGLVEAIGFHLPANIVLQGFLPFAVVVGIVYHVLLNRSRFGFDLRATPGRCPECGAISATDLRTGAA